MKTPASRAESPSRKLLDIHEQSFIKWKAEKIKRSMRDFSAGRLDAESLMRQTRPGKATGNGLTVDHR